MSRFCTALLLVTACSGGEDPVVSEPTSSTPDAPEPTLADNFGVAETEGDPACDNLAPSDCFYPFPTAHFIDTSGSTPSLRIPLAAMPGGGSAEFRPEPFERFEAYGAATPVLFQLPGAMVPDIFPLDGASSLGDDAMVVAIDAATGDRVPGWLETDYLAPDTEEVLFTFRPAVPWPRGTDIVIGVRGLPDTSGGLADVAEGFRALRDSETSSWQGVHGRREHFEAVVFPALEGQGFARDELQLAWSFPVRTDESATRRLLQVRDAIFEALPADGPDYQLDEVLECPLGASPLPEGCDPNIRTKITGTIFVPSVLQPPGDLGIRNLRVDSNDRPIVEGTEAWTFRVQIPHTAYDPARTEPVAVLQYGHGFLGSLREADGGWVGAMAERKGAMIIATSMMGMNEADALTWTGTLLGDAGRFPELAEKSMQGVIIQVVQQRMVKTTFASDPEPLLRRPDGGLVYDPDRVYYHGNSQGGSVGTLTMAMSLDVERGDLGVPGSGYPFLLHRSSVFQAFTGPISSTFPEPDAISRFLAVLGTGWDDVDPLTFAPHMWLDPLPGTPTHEALLHVAKEDQQVHNEASFILGRASGATVMTPTVRPVFDLPEVGYPATPGVALVEVDFMVPDDPTPLDPPDGDAGLPNDGDSHGWLRRWEPAQDQMFHFFETGELIDVCAGEPCVTEPDP